MPATLDSKARSGLPPAVGRRYASIGDYHALDGVVSVRRASWPSLDLALVREPEGEVGFTALARNAVVIDLAGSRRHLTRMDGTVDDRPTRTGDVLLAPAGMGLSLGWAPARRWQDCISIEFDGALFATYAPDAMPGPATSGHLRPRHYRPDPTLAALGRLLAREADPAGRRGRLFAETVIRLLAIELAGAWTSGAVPAGRGNSRDRPDRRIGRALDYIAAHLADDVSLTDLAGAAGLSVSQVSTLFRAATGRSPYAYLIDQRVQAAARMLRSTDTPIAWVAVACGFADQSHLTRTLRARLGVTPGEMRRA